MNDLAPAMAQLLAGGLSILRENAITPRLVYNAYGDEARQLGATIDLFETTELSARDITPAPTAPEVPTQNALKPAVRQLRLDHFKEVPFFLTDSEIARVSPEFLPRQMEQAVRTLANEIDKSILGLYKHVYQTVGTAGTTPFGSSLIECQQVSRVLSSNLAPPTDRYMVLDEFAYYNAMGIPTLQRVNEAGSSETLREGRITRLMGYEWHENQNVLNHTTTATGTYATAAAATAAAVTVTVNNGAGGLPAPLVVGDIIKFANHSQQYVVTSYTPATSNAAVGISPALAVAVPNNTAITVTAAHTANLAFHREAFAFASRPIADLPDPNVFLSMTDPITGITLRLEVTRQYKRTYFSLDCLWGVLALRPQLAVRILG
jgi:hypothetical protein